MRNLKLPVLELGNLQAWSERIMEWLAGVTSTATKRGKVFARQIRAIWQRLSLVQQFSLIASTVVLLGMITIGLWVSKRIEEGVTQNTAAAAALYMDGLIAPLVQELAHGNSISAVSALALDKLIRKQQKSSSHIMAIKIWRKGGVVAFSTWRDLEGRQFKSTPNLKRAWRGTVSAAFDHVIHEENSVERSLNMRLLEVYAPVRATNSDRIIAVSEFYLSADVLNDDLFSAVTQSWLVVGATSAAIVLALFGIVRGGSLTIERQRASLELQISSLRGLLDENQGLRKQIERAYRRATEVNERVLRRIGSDLHDGPAQLLGLALLRLDSLHVGETKQEPSSNRTDMEIIKNALDDAMQEIRHLSAGLALPELDQLTLMEVVDLAARSHEKRTSTKVKVTLSGTEVAGPQALKECLYRFVQEALNNSFRHADATKQAVKLHADDKDVAVIASDGGAGMKNNGSGDFLTGLGLIGLRDRVEACGGKFEIFSAAGKGTRLSATFNLKNVLEVESNHA